jgi:hypothetical protein
LCLNSESKIQGSKIRKISTAMSNSQIKSKFPYHLIEFNDIKIDIITRKGEFVNFTNQNDVKVQLEFEKKGV